MKNAKKFVRGALGAIVALAIPAVSYAQEFATSSVPGYIADLRSDAAQVMSPVIYTILGLLAALIALGWGVSKFRKYIAGRKF